MSAVYVCFNGDGPVTEDGFDGVRYRFEKGVTLELSPQAAQHIFGYGLEDKTKAFVRQGVMRHSGQYQDGMSWLAQFAFAEQESEIPDLSAKKARTRRTAAEQDAQPADSAES